MKFSPNQCLVLPTAHRLQPVKRSGVIQDLSWWPCALSLWQDRNFCRSSHVCIAFTGLGTQFLFFSGGANPTRSDSCFYPVPHTLDVLALTSAALWLSVLCLMLQVAKAAVFSWDNWVLRCRGERAGSWEKSQLVLICIPAPQNSLETSSAVDCTGMMGEDSSESHARAKRDS